MVKEIKQISKHFKTQKQCSLFVLNLPDPPPVLFPAPHEERGQGREERITRRDVVLTSGICFLWSLFREFFNKEHRKWSLGRCHEVIITGVLFLSTNNIFSINICEWIGYFPDTKERCYHLFFFKKNTALAQRRGSVVGVRL